MWFWWLCLEQCVSIESATLGLGGHGLAPPGAQHLLPTSALNPWRPSNLWDQGVRGGAWWCVVVPHVSRGNIPPAGTGAACREGVDGRWTGPNGAPAHFPGRAATGMVVCLDGFSLDFRGLGDVWETRFRVQRLPLAGAKRPPASPRRALPLGRRLGRRLGAAA